MDYQDSHKRFKRADGSPVAVTNAAANLPAYQPPPPLPIAANGPGGFSNGSPSARPSASVERSTTPGNKPGLRLTVKAPPSKLRQATSNGAPDIVHARSIPPNPYTGSGIESESDVTPAPPAERMARSTRNPRAVVEPESEEEDEEDAEGEDEEMDGEAEVDQELLANDDDEEEEEDAEGEEEDTEDHPPPPIIKRQPASKTGRAHVTVTAPSEGPLKSVETKQMEDDDDDDEELSELEEDDDDENELDSTLANDPDDLSSDADAQGSRNATPDLSKLTARQRGLYVQEDVAGSTVESAGLMALSNEALKKKHFTDEEHAMRRQEMARRRKNLSDRRNEEEKMETINKLLLKKSNPKRRSRAEIIAAQYAEAVAGQTSRGTPGLLSLEDGGVGGEAETIERAEPWFTRYVMDSRGARLGVPGEWAGAPVGEVFWGTGGVGGRGRRRMVEEVG
ncbi:hypothetical protein LTR35_010861 [Friedmanniomyces endolithicus]|uniref:INO80 complex subunit B-like conserved region domain-containing protein n=1 Tax=Friedmanniomyces endolithicus TaxID=329885 RepID=A0AAN6F666_9PEZI|nr:hypothetical protein LTS00_017360 [Friedmanniomyces endolithicus]KAK0275591.1 hypothetical protein LTR35_010861 [Friedmanniomyces endolithicus]KAK0302643.1 hypothetical protein LTR82_017801 [Friedmanniomyces endolithicus]